MMNRSAFIAVFIISLLLGGCNMPVSVSVQKNLETLQIPEATLTALFSQEILITPMVGSQLQPTTPVDIAPGNEEPVELITPVEEALLAEPTTVTDTPLPSKTPEPTATLTSEPTITGTATALSVQNQTSSGSTGQQIIIVAATPVPPTSTVMASVVPTLTPTSLPTATITPIPTATFQCDRALGKLEAYHFTNGGPTLDGNFVEWSGLSPVYSADYVVYGRDKWMNDLDLSGRFQVGWDQNFLYMAVSVQDERYVQLKNSWEIYMGDSLEIFLDANYCGDYNDKEMSSDDYQIGISGGYLDMNGIKEAYQWFPAPGRPLGQVIIYSQRIGEVTYYEYKIPWSVFGIAQVFPGNQFGFVLSISDNDNMTGESMQETMVSSAAHRAFNPKTWPMLILNP